MSVTQEALEITAALCRTFEGLYLKPYLCPAGVPTIGIGSTLYEDGTRVTLQDPPITAERAEFLLQLTLRRDYLPGVVKASPGLLKSASRLGAIVDFAYNAGVPRYRASTMRKRIDAEDWEGAKVECLRWNKGGGRVLPGLTKRCQARAALLG
jgi:lysozyme